MVTCESLDHIGSLSESAQSANQSILVRASDKFQKEKNSTFQNMQNLVISQ